MWLNEMGHHEQNRWVSVGCARRSGQDSSLKKARGSQALRRKMSGTPGLGEDSEKIKAHLGLRKAAAQPEALESWNAQPLLPQDAKAEAYL